MPSCQRCGKNIGKDETYCDSCKPGLIQRIRDGVSREEVEDAAMFISWRIPLIVVNVTVFLATLSIITIFSPGMRWQGKLVALLVPLILLNSYIYYRYVWKG